jgi:hypothetical protein
VSVLDVSGWAAGPGGDLVAARSKVFLETGTYGGKYVAAFVNASAYPAVWSALPGPSVAQFDHHWIHWPKPESGARLGSVYSSEDEMRYGPRSMDAAGLARLRDVVAARESLPAPPVSLE